MSETLQIVTAILSFLGTSLVAVLAFLTFKLNLKHNATAHKVDTVVVATEKMGEKVVRIEKQTDGMATTLGAAMLAQGLAQGGMEERNRADDKATAKAESGPAVTESVKGIIAEYKAGELKDDVAELSKTATETKKVVEGIDKKT